MSPHNHGADPPIPVQATRVSNPIMNPFREKQQHMSSSKGDFIPVGDDEELLVAFPLPRGKPATLFGPSVTSKAVHHGGIAFYKHPTRNNKSGSLAITPPPGPPPGQPPPKATGLRPFIPELNPPRPFYTSTGPFYTSTGPTDSEKPPKHMPEEMKQTPERYDTITALPDPPKSEDGDAGSGDWHDIDDDGSDEEGSKLSDVDLNAIGTSESWRRQGRLP